MLGIPVVHLDSIFWKENWIEQDDAVVKQKIAEAIAKESWIIEGYLEPLSRQRVQAAEIVIYLDFPGYRAAQGGLNRMLRHRKVPRPEMPKGNVDKFGYAFLKSLYKREERPEIERAVSNNPKLIRLTSRRAVKKYLCGLV